mgnify:CR=1 FL=1
MYSSLTFANSATCFWVLDCVPTNIEERKNNIRKFYDVCNEVIDDPSCFYTEQEIEELKNNPKKQKEVNLIQ